MLATTNLHNYMCKHKTKPTNFCLRIQGFIIKRSSRFKHWIGLPRVHTSFPLQLEQKRPTTSNYTHCSREKRRQITTTSQPPLRVSLVIRHTKWLPSHPVLPAAQMSRDSLEASQRTRQRCSCGEIRIRLGIARLICCSYCRTSFIVLEFLFLTSFTRLLIQGSFGNIYRFHASFVQTKR